ncbi:protein of unknown function [Azospirillum baldaniorum]|uniref:Uncharacterized protein n=1 Tax=Azospirillum baldaniorum TaxID=1064539 RepID=A0A9P1NL20_9PROT|nr:protein of unknown function [Azospirillum baldaniorum]
MPSKFWPDTPITVHDSHCAAARACHFLIRPKAMRA